MKKYYTTAEVLEILNISRATFNRMRANDEFFLPTIIGKSNRWSVERMNEYLRIMEKVTDLRADAFLEEQ